METTDGNDDNTPASHGQLLPTLQIPQREHFSPQSSSPSSSRNSMDESNSIPPATTTISTSHLAATTTTSHLAATTTTITTSHPAASSSRNWIPHPPPPPTTMPDHPESLSPKYIPRPPPSPLELSLPSQIPMTESPSMESPQQPLFHKSSMMPPPPPPTTMPDHPETSSPNNYIPRPPLSPLELSTPSQIPMPESPSMSSPQQPLFHQSSMMPPPPPPPYYYPPPMGMPPPFPYMPAPFPPHHDQFHPFYYPMLPANGDQVLIQPWSTGLFDCFSDLKNCFITCVCPCVTFGQVDEIISEGHMAWWEGALMFGFLEMVCFSQASFIVAWYHRAQFRKKYKLIGNLLSELAIALFCTRLVLCQNYRQLKHLGFDVALGWKANKKKERRLANQAAPQFVPPVVNPGMFR